MPKKKNKTEEHESSACACGSTSFIEEGSANFKDNVTITIEKGRTQIMGGCPELDITTSTIKCAQCGAEFNA